MHMPYSTLTSTSTYIIRQIFFKNSLVIHEGNTKQISTMTVTLYLIKLIDVRKNTNEHRILYKRIWDFILNCHPN